MAFLALPNPRRLLRTVLIAVVGSYAVAAVVLLLVQDRLLYHPRQVPADLQVLRLPRPGEAIRYALAPGDPPEALQTAYWLPPVDGREPARIWLVLAGNASLATSLAGLADPPADPRTGYLFVDHPGYGANPGAPSPATILAGSRAAVAALTGRWGWTAEDRRRRLAVFGHSLGAAAALQHAAAEGACRVVLAAPFTRMLDMAQRSVGWPLCQVLRHRFDNAARLDELLARPDAPPVTILHGDADELIPVEMGRRLAEAHPGRVDFRPVPGARHNGVVFDHLPLLRSVLAETGQP